MGLPSQPLLQDARPRKADSACGWPADPLQRGLDPLPHDPDQLVPRDQQLLVSSLLPSRTSTNPRISALGSCPRLDQPPQLIQGIRRERNAVDPRPATPRRATRMNLADCTHPITNAHSCMICG